MKLRPLADFVVIQRVKEEEKTKGGIIIPDSAKEKPLEGTVLSVGPGKILKSGKVLPIELKEGNRVLFSKYAGTEITLDGQDRLLVKEDDILAIVDG
jgi:chaperonin GroES